MTNATAEEPRERETSSRGRERLQVTADETGAADAARQKELRKPQWRREMRFPRFKLIGAPGRVRTARAARAHVAEAGRINRAVCATR